MPTSCSRCAVRKRRSCRATRRARWSSRIMDPYGNEAALARHGQRRHRRLRDGAPAAHHPRAGDGRAVEPGQSRRLSRRDRCRRRIRPGAADDDDRGRHRAGDARVRHGRRRRRPAGDRDGAPARRRRHRDRRAAGGQGAGREPRRQIHRGRGRGIQAPPRPPAATPRKCRRSIRPSRPRSSPNTSRSRTSSSPRRSFPAGRRRG